MRGTLSCMRLAPVAVAASLVLLAGCSSTPPAPAPPVQTTPTPTPSSTFIDEMRSTGAFFGFPDGQLRDIAQTICEALDEGSTFDGLVETLAVNDFTEDQASTVIFASAREYCPEHER